MKDKNILKATAIVGAIAIFYKLIDALHAASPDTLAGIGVVLIFPVILFSVVGAIILGVKYT